MMLRITEEEDFGRPRPSDDDKGALGDGIIQRVLELAGVEPERVKALMEALDPDKIKQIMAAIML